jgi:hypothetical protein
MTLLNVTALRWRPKPSGVAAVAARGLLLGPEADHRLSELEVCIGSTCVVQLSASSV